MVPGSLALWWGGSGRRLRRGTQRVRLARLLVPRGKGTIMHMYGVQYASTQRNPRTAGP